MKSLKALQIFTLTTAALASGTAGASGYEYSAETPCDIRIIPKVLSYTDAKPIHRLESSAQSEYHYMTSHLEPAELSNPKLKLSLERECRSYIRKNYPEDVLYTDGPVLIARHYHCSEVTARGISSDNDEFIYGIDIQYGEAVIEKLTTEQILARKCESLNVCLLKSTGTDTKWISSQMALLGCN